MYLALSGTCHEFAISLNAFGSIGDIVLFKVKSECSILLIRVASFGVSHPCSVFWCIIYYNKNVLFTNHYLVCMFVGHVHRRRC